MSEFLTEFQALPNFCPYNPACETDVLDAQSLLGLTFANDYKEYLTAFGQADADGHELTGIIKSDRLNVVSATKREWGFNPLVPHSLYAVESTGIDGIVIWQDASGTVYQSAPNQKPQIIGDSLRCFLTAGG